MLAGVCEPLGGPAAGQVAAAVYETQLGVQLSQVTISCKQTVMTVAVAKGSSNTIARLAADCDQHDRTSQSVVYHGKLLLQMQEQHRSAFLHTMLLLKPLLLLSKRDLLLAQLLRHLLQQLTHLHSLMRNLMKLWEGTRASQVLPPDVDKMHQC